uniref:Uncharacterized protein n=1 Tax=Arundo donax TaxID=35708 RepID=A0A0A9BCI5_ARUDO
MIIISGQLPCARFPYSFSGKAAIPNPKMPGRILAAEKFQTSNSRFHDAEKQIRKGTLQS